MAASSKPSKSRIGRLQFANENSANPFVCNTPNTALCTTLAPGQQTLTQLFAGSNLNVKVSAAPLTTPTGATKESLLLSALGREEKSIERPATPCSTAKTPIMLNLTCTDPESDSFLRRSVNPEQVDSVESSGTRQEHQGETARPQKVRLHLRKKGSWRTQHDSSADETNLVSIICFDDDASSSQSPSKNQKQPKASSNFPQKSSSSGFVMPFAVPGEHAASSRPQETKNVSPCGSPILPVVTFFNAEIEHPNTKAKSRKRIRRLEDSSEDEMSIEKERRTCKPATSVRNTSLCSNSEGPPNSNEPSEVVTSRCFTSSMKGDPPNKSQEPSVSVASIGQRAASDDEEQHHHENNLLPASSLGTHTGVDEPEKVILSAERGASWALGHDSCAGGWELEDEPEDLGEFSRPPPKFPTAASTSLGFAPLQHSILQSPKQDGIQVSTDHTQPLAKKTAALPIAPFASCMHSAKDAAPSQPYSQISETVRRNVESIPVMGASAIESRIFGIAGAELIHRVVLVRETWRDAAGFIFTREFPAHEADQPAVKIAAVSTAILTPTPPSDLVRNCTIQAPPPVVTTNNFGVHQTTTMPPPNHLPQQAASRDQFKFGPRRQPLSFPPSARPSNQPMNLIPSTLPAGMLPRDPKNISDSRIYQPCPTPLQQFPSTASKIGGIAPPRLTHNTATTSMPKGSLEALQRPVWRSSMQEIPDDEMLEFSDEDDGTASAIRTQRDPEAETLDPRKPTQSWQPAPASLSSLPSSTASRKVAQKASNSSGPRRAQSDGLSAQARRFLQAAVDVDGSEDNMDEDSVFCPGAGAPRRRASKRGARSSSSRGGGGRGHWITERGAAGEYQRVFVDGRGQRLRGSGAYLAWKTSPSPKGGEAGRWMSKRGAEKGTRGKRVKAERITRVKLEG